MWNYIFMTHFHCWYSPFIDFCKFYIESESLKFHPPVDPYPFTCIRQVAQVCAALVSAKREFARVSVTEIISPKVRKCLKEAGTYIIKCTSVTLRRIQTLRSVELLNASWHSSFRSDFSWVRVTLTEPMNVYDFVHP